MELDSELLSLGLEEEEEEEEEAEASLAAANIAEMEARSGRR